METIRKSLRPVSDGRDNRSRSSPSPSWTGAGLWVRLLILLLLASSIAGSADARAQTGNQYAGIVIRGADGTVTYAYVPLDAPTSGIDLLRRSGVSLVTVGFGGLGDAVCKIEETGCDVASCRSRVCQTGDRESPYWRYFQSDPSGSWVASPLGGSGTKVAPGEIDGWSWTPDEAHLPEVEIDSIPTLAGASGSLDKPHFARYGADGTVLGKNGADEIPWSQYIAVTSLLVGVAGFALYLKLRAEPAT